MLKLPLRNRAGAITGYTFVDDCDDWTLDHRWRLHSKGYACRGTTIDGKYVVLLLHRVIMNAPVGLEVDHIDLDKLNNVRSNLRITTHAQNNQNRPLNANNTSGYRGVTFDKKTGRWAAYAMLDGKRKHVGYFDEPDEAAEAARVWRAEHMTHA